ncbi:VVA0879 family protein [Lacipirellula sp.]|uniref:VVA0879 family protein n=1 Tax=Lacipirellula sp. TaxID=2691419 RepID=UPI003D118B1B
MLDVKLTEEQWREELQRRYGDNLAAAKFVCPSCGFVQSRADFETLGMGPEVIGSMLAYSCIGRYRRGQCQAAFTGGPGPCDYAGGGLIMIAPVIVISPTQTVRIFDFADDPLVPREATVNG